MIRRRARSSSAGREVARRPWPRPVLVALLAVCLGLGAAVAAPASLPMAGATDAAEDASALTVAWSGDNPPEVQGFQPQRDPDPEGYWAKSGHWSDFKDVKVAVSKTRGLRDEVVTVRMTGLPQTDLATTSNFYQLMQCWGDDPNAADFAKNCQFGALGEGGAYFQVLRHGVTFTRGAVSSQQPGQGPARIPFPFRASTGDESKPFTFTGPTGVVTDKDGLETFFSAQSTNERPYVPVDANGVAVTTFEVKSARTQPYLGCGGEAPGAERCWLVVVPRGIHSGAWPEDRDTGFPCQARSGGVTDIQEPFGQKMGMQSGSPVNPDCNYFLNRVVVPLDFVPTSGGCLAGRTERRVLGSEFMSDAFASWQRAVCQREGGAIYSMNTVASDQVRGQLLTGEAALATMIDPIAEGRIGSASAEQLGAAALRYAPLTNTALVLGMNVRNDRQQITELKLTPRLIAKLLTQSYSRGIPWAGLHFMPELVPSARDRGAAKCIDADPEWLALGNPPGRTKNHCFGTSALVTMGPHGDDSTAALWRYLQADADAAAFLAGEPDPWGMSINPYYLPAGHDRAMGGGLAIRLAKDRLDRHLRADQTLAPMNTAATSESARIDSTAFMPFVGDHRAVASRIFSGSNGGRTAWNSNAHMWVADPPPVPGAPAFVIGPTSAAEARHYQLTTAALPAPLDQLTTRDTVQDARTFVAPDDRALRAAAATAVNDATTGFSTIDQSKLVPEAYPLTLVVNAAADLNSAALDGRARTDYAELVRFAALEGQTPGEGYGQLPDGFVPLTAEQRELAGRFASELATPKTGVQPPAPPAPPTRAGGGTPAPTPPAATPTAASPQQPATQSGVRALDVAETHTPEAAAQTALGLTLLAGIGGAAAAPFLLRRRGMGA